MRVLKREKYYIRIALNQHCKHKRNEHRLINGTYTLPIAPGAKNGLCKYNDELPQNGDYTFVTFFGVIKINLDGIKI
jgi:hypothetical protein